MKKYKVDNKNVEVMDFMDFQDYIEELFFDDSTEFSLRKEVKEFDGLQVIDYTVTLKDDSIVLSACVTPLE